MRRVLAAFLLSLMTSAVCGQIVGPGGSNPTGVVGPVAILITSPETGPGLGPKKEVNEEFDLHFELQLANLTVENVSLEVLVLDENGETYIPFNGEWIVDRANVSWESLRGPTIGEGYFRLKIPERGYYFFKVRADYTLDGRQNTAEGGDIAFGPRIRVIPGLSNRSYAVLLGMPFLPLFAGIVVRTARRRDTKKRRRKTDPEWLAQLKKEHSGQEGER